MSGTLPPPDPSAVHAELGAALRRYVRGRVADPHAAEDIVQDVFLALSRQLQQGLPTGPLHAWLFRVARNAVVDHHRRRRKSTSTSADGADIAGTDDTELAGEAGQLLASCRRFLHELPEEQREAIVATEYEGVSQAELARRLGLSASTIKSRVQRGRQRLEQALRDCCTFEFDRRGGLVDWQRRPGGGCTDCN